MKEALATSAQRKFLRGLGFEPWRAMLKEDAHRLLNALTCGGDVPPGHWIDVPATEKQIELMRRLELEVPENCTNGQARWLISRMLDG